jgi:hypothetical protein
MNALVDYYMRHAKNATPEQIFENKAQLYTTHLPNENVARMLDWDKAVSEQAPEVQAALQKLGFEGNKYYVRGQSYFSRAEAQQATRRAGVPESAIMQSEPGVVTGQEVYKELARRAGSEQAASETLRGAGLPGLRYLDQQSRAMGMTKYNVKWGPKGGAEVFDRATGKSMGEFPTFADADQWVAANRDKPTSNFVVFHQEALGPSVREGTLPPGYSMQETGGQPVIVGPPGKGPQFVEGGPPRPRAKKPFMEPAPPGPPPYQNMTPEEFAQWAAQNQIPVHHGTGPGVFRGGRQVPVKK